MSIERVTITIKKDVLKRIDNMVNKESVKNRSHAIEQLLQKAIGRTAVNGRRRWGFFASYNL